MVKQTDIVNPRSSDGNIDDYEEYSEEEILSDESNEGFCEESHGGLCIDGSNIEDLHEDFEEEVFEEDPTEGIASEEVSDGSSEEDLKEDVSYKEIIEEEISEQPGKEPNEEEWLKGSIDRPPHWSCSYHNTDEKAPDVRFPETENSPDASSNKYPMNPSNLSIDPNARNSRKRRHSRWDIKPDAPLSINDVRVLGKRRKTRWSSDETPLHPLDSMVLNLAVINNDQTMQNKYAKLQDINQMLESGAIVDNRPEGKRSPSPPPIYDDLGNRINTREFRLRSKLIKQKQKLFRELLNSSKKKEKCKPTPEFLFRKKLYIPVKEYPNYNFSGLILGPRGNTLKAMEKETGAVIRLRGKGSNVKGKKIFNGKDDLHVFIAADSQTTMDAAVSMVEKLLIPVEDGQNYHKAAQLRELAILNGTYKGKYSAAVMDPCDVCGSSTHTTSNCPLTATAAQIRPNFPVVSGSIFSSFRSQNVLPNTLPLENKKHEEKPNKVMDNSNFPAVSRSLFSSFSSQNISCNPLPLETLKHEDKRNKGIDDFNFPTVSGSLFSSFRSQNVCPSPLLLETKKHEEKTNKVIGDSNFPAVSGSLFSSFRSQNVSPSPLLLETKKNEEKPKKMFDDSDFPSMAGSLFSSFRSQNLSPNFLPSETMKNEEKPKKMVDDSNLPAVSGGLFLSLRSQNVSPSPLPSENKKHDGKPNQVIDDCNLFVGCLPHSVDDSKLMELFHPYGKLCDVKVLRDWNTGKSKGCGFVKYSTPDNAAKAIAHMDGYRLEGRRLAVRVAGIAPPSMNATSLPCIAAPASIPQPAPDTGFLLGPTGSMLSEPPTSLPKINHKPSNNVQNAPLQSPALFGSTFQASTSFSQGVVPVSSDLASFPGFLKSIDPPNQMAPLQSSTSVVIPVSSDLANFPGFLKSIDPPIQKSHLGSSTSFVPSFQASTSSSQGGVPISSEPAAFPGFLRSSDSPYRFFSSLPSCSLSLPHYFSINPFSNRSHPTGR